MKGNQSVIRKQPTSREGSLIGVVRPLWMKVTESEQRISWLDKMVKRKLCVKDLESYISAEHRKLRSPQYKIREDERGVLMNLMTIKLKDEKRNIEVLRKNKESMRKRLKRELGGSRTLHTIIKK